MRSASDRFPRESTLLTSWVTSTEWYTGSGMSSRRGAGPFLGIALRPIPGPRLLAVADAGGIEGAADDLVANAGEVADAAATDQHDGVLLEVVADTGDVGR